MLFADEEQAVVAQGGQQPLAWPPQGSTAQAPRLRVVRADAAELALHEQRLAAIDDASGGVCVWRRLVIAAAERTSEQILDA